MLITEVAAVSEVDAAVDLPEDKQRESQGLQQRESESSEPTTSSNVVCFTLRSARNRAEAQAIRQALGHSGWNRRRAARLLEISYRSLLLKIQQHKITRQTQ
jgi:two-component system, NtrC family, response regulator AtoC